RLAAGLTLVVALSFQIIEKVANNDMVPEEYFSYFTILSSMIASVALIVGGLMALRTPVDTVLYTTVRMSVFAYAVVTAIVYNVLLRGIPEEGFIETRWPGELMHVWIPLFIALDWLISPGRPALRWTGLRYVVIYPLAWLAFTMLRGAVTGWYPYPFLEPSTGPLSIIVYVLGISVFIVGLASLAIAWSRRGARGGPAHELA
ncbi:MAG: Pr6Pr family membrane protein, partial [Salinibacterium sp.]|nr:Pr6Pr family membrane protein [Salinibacterium sp.]